MKKKFDTNMKKPFPEVSTPYPHLTPMNNSLASKVSYQSNLYFTHDMQITYSYIKKFIFFFYSSNLPYTAKLSWRAGGALGCI